MTEVGTGVYFNEAASKRIARAVRIVEREGLDHRLPRRRGRRRHARELVRFDGICMIDEANPGTKHPDIDNAHNDADAVGDPLPGERKWLLLKCTHPFLSSTNDDPGQELHAPMLLTNVTMSTCTRFWWEYYLITEPFLIESGVEELTVFDETDSAGDLTVTASTVTFDTMRRDAHAHVGKSYGAGHFTDYTHQFSARATGHAGFWGILGLWGVGDEIASQADRTTGLGVWYCENAGAAPFIRLQDYGNSNTATYVGLAEGTTYWFTVQKIGTTAKLWVHTDAGRTTLLNPAFPLTIVCQNTARENLLVGYSYNSLSNPTHSVSGWVKNFDIIEVPTWNTKPAMVWGSSGLIDLSLPPGGFMSCSTRHISCCTPGFGYARTVYGICLRPYEWMGGDANCDVDWEVDYRKWMIRLE